MADVNLPFVEMWELSSLTISTQPLLLEALSCPFALL